MWPFKKKTVEPKPLFPWPQQPTIEPERRIVRYIEEEEVRRLIQQERQERRLQPIQEFSIEEMLSEIHRRATGFVACVLVNGGGNNPNWHTAASSCRYIRAVALTRLCDFVKEANEHKEEDNESITG